MRGHITDPAAEGGLALRELPEPEPSPHDVVVRVGAYGLNRGELALLEQRSDGWRPGQDVAGTVAAGAADRSGPSQGSRVVGIADGGGWSARVAVCPATGSRSMRGRGAPGMSRPLISPAHMWKGVIADATDRAGEWGVRPRAGPGHLGLGRGPRSPR